MNNAGLHRLGLIWPDDGLERPDYELLRGPDSASRLGVSAIELAVAFSRAAPRHERSDLLITGDTENLCPAARALAEQDCDAIVWACTSGSFIGGLAWARNQARELEQASQRPASSTTLAFIEAIQALSADTIELLAAYPADVGNAFRDCLASVNIRVGQLKPLGTPDASASWHLDIVSEVLAFAREAPGDNPIVLPDTAIDSLGLIEEMEAQTGRTVLTANQVTLWQGLRLMGLDAHGRGPGSLFRSNTIRGQTPPKS